MPAAHLSGYILCLVLILRGYGVSLHLELIFFLKPNRDADVLSLSGVDSHVFVPLSSFIYVHVCARQ